MLLYRRVIHFIRKNRILTADSKNAAVGSEAHSSVLVLYSIQREKYSSEISE